MVTYVLHCTTCDREFETRKEWLVHLTQEEHQNLTKEGITEWTSSMKKCALVVIASFPVPAFELLEYFSQGQDIVTDFVDLWKKPHAGILQFESKNKVKEILDKLKSPQVRIADQVIQLKKASTFLELEWEHLIEDSQLLNESNHRGQLNADNRLKKSVDLNLTGSGGQDVIKVLEEQFTVIKKTIEIPDEDFSKAESILERLSHVFNPTLPSCRFYLVRNWYLKLRPRGTEELYIYLDHFDKLNGCKKTVKFLLGSEDKVLDSQEAQQILKCRRIGSGTNESFEISYIDLETDLRFTLVAHPWLKLDAQTNRLLKYMCSFDDKVLPLLALVHYWVKINHVELSNSEGKHSKLDFTPEPAALEWLAMLILCQKKMVPSPREIVTEPRKLVTVFRNDVDVGFSEDPNFVKEWRELRNSKNSDIMSILELAENFFSSYAPLKNSFCVLNPRDGEIIKTSTFFNNSIQVEQVTKMSTDEIRNVRDRAKSAHKSVLMHPLCYKHRFYFMYDEFAKSVCPLMSITAEKLKTFLESFRSDSNTGQVDLKNLLKV